MELADVDQFLFVGALVLVASILAVRFSLGVGVPSLIAYLAIGVVLGESVIGIEFEDYDLAHTLGFAALMIILAEGGLTTRWEHGRRALPVGISLATVGVAVSTTLIALFGRYVLHLDWQLAVLLGAVVSPTDAAAVFSTLRRVNLRPRLAGALEAESGMNDAPTVVLVILVSAGTALDHGVLGFLAQVGYQLAVGTAVGGMVGWLGVVLLRRAALPASGLYPLAVMTFALLAYAGALEVRASGFAAVYVAGLVLGNSDLPHRAATRSFAEGLAWLSQIGLFVMLGLLASPARLLGVIVPALAVGLVLTLLVRPLSVWVSAAPFRMPVVEQIYLSWAGLRGAIPVILATVPLSEGVPRAEYLFDLVFVFVVVFTIIQALPLASLARVLRVDMPEQARDLDVEVAPLDRVAADLLQVRVTEGSQMNGVEVGELRLPPGVVVSLVLRGEATFVPTPRTMLRHDDEMLIVAPRRLREETERRLRAVSRRGRLAGWFGERGH